MLGGLASVFKQTGAHLIKFLSSLIRSHRDAPAPRVKSYKCSCLSLVVYAPVSRQSTSGVLSKPATPHGISYIGKDQVLREQEISSTFVLTPTFVKSLLFLLLAPILATPIRSLTPPRCSSSPPFVAALFQAPTRYSDKFTTYIAPLPSCQAHTEAPTLLGQNPAFTRPKLWRFIPSLSGPASNRISLNSILRFRRAPPPRPRRLHVM